MKRFFLILCSFFVLTQVSFADVYDNAISLKSYNSYVGRSSMSKDFKTKEGWLLKAKKKFPEYRMGTAALLHSLYVSEAVRTSVQSKRKALKYVAKARKIDKEYLAYLKSVTEDEFKTDPMVRESAFEGQMISKFVTEDAIVKSLEGLEELKEEIREGALEK